MRMNYSDQDLKFVKENYETYGIGYCVNNTSLNARQIMYIANTKFKLNRVKKDVSYPITIERIFDRQDEYASYCLGLLWTDGCVHKRQIFLTTTEPDVFAFEPIMNRIGKWGKSRIINSKNPTWKIRHTFQTTNPFLSKKLIDLNFNNKELGFDKIYENILEKYKKYFWIGVVDGDGCFFSNPKGGIYTFSLCSSYNQNWDCFVSFLDTLKVKYKIERTKSNSGDYSKVLIIGKYEVKKFGDYLYSTFDQDGIGLDRKYQKFNSIKDRCKDIQPKYWGKSKSEIKILKSLE